MRLININKSLYLFSLLVLLACSSCGINSSLMFKIPKGSDAKADTSNAGKYYKLYDKDSIPLIPTEDYRISKDDKFTFTLSTNDGQRILEGLSGVGGTVANERTTQQLEYVVRPDGYAFLPVIGDVKLIGMTVKKSEDTLAKLFSAHYLNPFVQLRVTNQRVIIFPGDGGEAKVVLIKNNNTTLMEVIAEAGGISDRGKANSIKLMRSINGKREIYPIDLSKIEGLAYADMIVQANDYIYVEPHPKLGREALAQAAPFVTILSSVLVIFTVFNNLK